MKKKMLLATTSVLLAMNMSCGTTQSNNKIEPRPSVKQEIVEQQNVEQVKEFSTFKDKSVVTLSENIIDTKPEMEKDEYIEIVKEFNKQFALLKLKVKNNEKVSINEICNLRGIFTELTNLTEKNLENSYTNADSMGQIILKKASKELEEKLILVNEIESYFYGVSKEYDKNRELNCFVNGEVIPSMVNLKKYSNNIIEDKLSEEEICKINDVIIRMNELLKAAVSPKQKIYLIKTIESLKKKLPKEIQKEDSLDFEDNCNVLFPLRE